VTRLPCGLGLNSAVTIPIFPYDSTGSLHESIHAIFGDMMAECNAAGTNILQRENINCFLPAFGGLCEWH
jgi:hypothetical protein